MCFFFFFQAEDGIRDLTVTGVQTCALPICHAPGVGRDGRADSPRDCPPLPLVLPVPTAPGGGPGPGGARGRRGPARDATLGRAAPAALLRARDLRRP